MGLRQKFSLLACLSGALMAIVSIIGCYTSYINLSDTLESEITSTVDAQGKDLDTWLQSKAVSAEYAANLLGNLGDINRMKDRNLLSLTTSDKDILDVTIGLQDKYLYGYHAGDFTGKIDPTIRPWYNDAKNGLT
ncbi:MAG: methyl-accepting chemotaxis protein, partial [Selenomonadaceae bacterium]|nr:methyl-accepting chemotaxis protein [Selenomonadaceae bacterium]